MKKLITMACALLFAGGIYALPVGNPADARLLTTGIFCEGSCQECDLCDPCFSWCDAFSFRFGFYGDYVFNRHLCISNSDFDDDNDRDIEHTEIFTNAGYLALNFCNRFDLFATLGQTNLFLETSARDFVLHGLMHGIVVITAMPHDVRTPLDLASSRFFLETSDRFSWSVGANGILWECGCWTLGRKVNILETTPRSSGLV
jgi:major outer membrane protein